MAVKFTKLQQRALDDLVRKDRAARRPLVRLRFWFALILTLALVWCLTS